MSDEEKPQEKKTVEFAQPPRWAIDHFAALGEKMGEGFRRVDSRFDAVEANQELQGGSLLDHGKRMIRLEERMDLVENRRAADSISPSKHDLKTESRLAQEIVAREALAQDVATIKAETSAQTVMLTEAKAAATKLWAKPEVKMLTGAIWAAFLYWLGTKGIKLP